MINDQLDHATKAANPEATNVEGTADAASDKDLETTYDRFVERVGERFVAGQEKSFDAIEKAMDATRQQFTAASDFSVAQGELFKNYMRRDLDQTAHDIRTFNQETKDHLHPARLGAGALSALAHMLQSAGSAIQSLSQKTEDAVHYGTGEITTAGTLTCTHCGQSLHLKRTSHVPPCPSCHGTQFRKGY